MKTVTFIVAAREFFGLLPGQTLADFSKEIKALTVNDRTELVEMFKTVGFDATKTA